MENGNGISSLPVRCWSEKRESWLALGGRGGGNGRNASSSLQSTTLYFLYGVANLVLSDLHRCRSQLVHTP